MTPESRDVVLGGRHAVAFEPLVRALAEVKARLGGRRVVLVGGLAVAVRLAIPERATADVDSVVQLGRAGPGAVELLLASGPGVSRDTGHRVMVGPVAVDLIDARPSDHEEPTMLSRKDALFLTAARFALDTATPVRVRAGAVQVDAAVATPAGLVATKLHAVLFRSEEAKRATDAFDLHRLLSQHDVGGAVAALLARVRGGLPELVAWAGAVVFEERLAEYARLMRASGDPVIGSVAEVDLRAVGEAFLAVLRAEADAP